VSSLVLTSQQGQNDDDGDSYDISQVAYVHSSISSVERFANVTAC